MGFFVLHFITNSVPSMFWRDEYNNSSKTQNPTSIAEIRNPQETNEPIHLKKKALHTILQSNGFLVMYIYMPQFFTVVTCFRSISTTSLEILEASFFNCSILALVSCSSLFTFAPESPLVCIRNQVPVINNKCSKETRMFKKNKFLGILPLRVSSGIHAPYWFCAQKSLFQPLPWLASF